MQSSNKFKPCIRCGCQSCRRNSEYKQAELRRSRREFRQNGAQELQRLVGLPVSLVEYFADKLLLAKAGAGYTD